MSILTETLRNLTRSSGKPIAWAPPPAGDHLLDHSAPWRGIGRSPSFPYPQYIAGDEHQTLFFDHGEGEPLVFVHGLGANCTNWEPILPVLEQGHRMVGLDLLGCGWTGKPDVVYTVDVLRDHLIGFLERRGITRATLIGHSMGGAVVLAVALARPDLVECLVLLDPAGLAPFPRWMQVAAHRVLNRRLLFPLLLLGAPFILRQVFFDRPHENAYVRWFYESSCRDAPGLPHLREFARFGEHICRDLVDRDCSARLGEIEAPVLVLWGEGDKLVDATLPLARLDGIRRLRKVVVPRAGHMPMVERPRETAAHIARFLADPP